MISSYLCMDCYPWLVAAATVTTTAIKAIYHLGSKLEDPVLARPPTMLLASPSKSVAHNRHKRMNNFRFVEIHFSVEVAPTCY